MSKTGVIIISLLVAVSFLIFPFVLYAGKSIMYTKTDSMIPVLKPYDMMVVEKVNIHEVKVDDIVVFDTHIEGIGIVAHRAIQVFNDHGEIGIDTKGDNVESSDGWIVHEEDFIGKVVNVLPGIGLFLVEPVRYGIAAVIVIMTISIMHEVMAKPKTA